MSTYSASSSSDNDQRPADQRERAEHAHLDPNEPATQAHAGTPPYGNFGKPNETEPGVPTVDASQNNGSNDNPDEFSELRDADDQQTKPGTTNANDPNPMQQRGHVEQNKDPQGVRNVQNADTDVQRGAWADDDERYAGGHRQASWEENNDKEHSND